VVLKRFVAADMGIRRGAKRAFAPLEIGTNTKHFYNTWNQQLDFD